MHALWLSLLAFVGGAPPVVENPEIIVAMTEFDGRRPATNIIARAIGQTEKLVARGEVTVDGRTFGIYLPPPVFGYTTKNTMAGGGVFYNSTAISVDHDGDGQIAPSESFHTHRPVRIGNAMYEVTHLAADGSEVRFRKTDVPATTLTRGIESDALRIETTDGKVTALADLRGQALLLKFWSPT